MIEDGIGTDVEEVHVFAYLRHPVPLYLSHIQQALKASSRFVAPQGYRRDTPATFLRWRGEPRCSTITARLFDRNHLISGSVVPDFEDYLRQTTGTSGVGLPDLQENSSLSTEQTILMQRFRRDFFAAEDGKFMPRSTQLVKFFEKLNNIGGTLGNKVALIDEVQSCIEQRNAPFVEKLNAIFPSLNMTRHYGSLTQNWQPYAKNWNEDVASILVKKDGDIFLQLESLIPEYNSTLRSGDASAAVANLLALADSPKSLRAFANFLRTGGFERAAAAVDSYMTG